MQRVLDTADWNEEASQCVMKQCRPSPKLAACGLLSHVWQSAPPKLLFFALIVPIGGGVSCIRANPFLNVCGNGYVEPENGEECDDGAENNGDHRACSRSCTLAECGDGIVQEGEECDQGPGNADDGTCTLECRIGVCGDGLVQADEECDDGEGNKATADGQGGCSALCVKLPLCGDGIVDPDFEECDDGNDDDSDACTSACTAAHCGDGIVQAGEECDDGDDDDSDACPTTCLIARCGDGLVAEGLEECDDGNDDDDDACLTGCVAATCGDAQVHAGVEECDDGNLDPDDGCSAECVLDRRVFVTAEGLGAAQVNGLAGADEICATEAQAAGLEHPQRFRAWLSDGVEAPASRLLRSTGRYVLITGEVIAESWADLTDGEIAHPIDRGPSGELLEVAVWTATRANGTGYDDDHCDGWTEFSVAKARHGWSDEVDSGWTDWAGLSITCGDGAHLYCFEEVPG